MLSTPVALYPGLYFMAISNTTTTARYDAHAMSPAGPSVIMYGVRCASGGGIVTTPTIVDPSTAVVSVTDSLLMMGVLGFDADELVEA